LLLALAQGMRMKEMNKKTYLKIYLILAMIIALASSAKAAEPKNQNNLRQNKIEPGTYVFVSFSMNDDSLRSYFIEAEKYGAKLVIRGLVGEKNSRNRFAQMKAKVEQARINVEINPNLFEQLNIKQIPVIAVVSQNGRVKKISGHISLSKALEIMQTERGNK
jgi:conjugal transfer pilus assembly protein TrbC